MSKEAEEFLSSHGLKNAIYCIDASDMQDDQALFGQLLTCPFRVRFWTEKAELFQMCQPYLFLFAYIEPSKLANMNTFYALDH